MLRGVAALGTSAFLAMGCGDDPKPKQDGRDDAGTSGEDDASLSQQPLVWAEGYTFLVTDVEANGRKSLWFLSTSGGDAYRVSDEAFTGDVQEARLSPDGTHVVYYAANEQGYAVDVVQLGPDTLLKRSRVAQTEVPGSVATPVLLTVTDAHFRVAYIHDELSGAAGGESLFLQDFDAQHSALPKALVHRTLEANEGISAARFVTSNHLVYRGTLDALPALYLHQMGGEEPFSGKLSPTVEGRPSGVLDTFKACGSRPTLAFSMSYPSNETDAPGVAQPRHVLAVHLGETAAPFAALTLSEREGAYLLERTVCSRDGLVIGYESASQLFFAQTTPDAVTQRAAIESAWGADAERFEITPVMAPSGMGMFIVVTDKQDGHSDLWFGDLSGATPVTPVKMAKLAGGVRNLEAENDGHLVVDRLRDRVYVVRETLEGAAQASTLDVVDGRVALVDIGGELPGSQRVVRFVCSEVWDVCYGVTASESFDKPGIDLWSLDPRAERPSPRLLASNPELLVGDIALRLVDQDRAMVVSGRLKNGTTRNYLLDLKAEEVGFGLIGGQNLSDKFWVADLHRVAGASAP